MATIDKYSDIIDSRDIIARIEELTEERDTLATSISEAQEELDDADDETILQAQRELAEACKDLADWHASDDAAELAALESLAEECEACGDWRYGERLIRDSYFKDYAMELADDIGAIPDNAQWPCTCIDWDKAAWELQMDYTSVDFDGVDYWIHS